MADRTSAGIFGDLFNRLATKRGAWVKGEAQWLWKQSEGYDFTPDQMDADEALVKFGLAKREPNPKYPEEGPVTLYLGLDY
jgi:hypothetical protein